MLLKIRRRELAPNTYVFRSVLSGFHPLSIHLALNVERDAVGSHVSECHPSRDWALDAELLKGEAHSRNSHVLALVAEACLRKTAGGLRIDARRHRGSALLRRGLLARREKHEEKIDRRADSGHDQKPVRTAKKRQQDHKIDEIAARGGIEKPREGPLGRIGYRGDQGFAAVLRAHQPPIDEAGRAQGPKDGSRAEP